MAENAFQIMKGFLDRFGLGGLANWAFDQLVENISPEEILLAMRERPEYKARFPGMDLRAKQGLRALSEAEYLGVEEEYKKVLRRAGVPVWKFDEARDFADLFGKDLHPDELAERAEVWRLVQVNPTTSARVRQIFREKAGISDLDNDDITRALLGFDERLVDRVSAGFGGDLSISGIKDSIREALAQEEALFQSTPGFAEERGVGVGLTSTEEESF